MKYIELARQVLMQADTPLSVKEIWNLAIRLNLDKKLRSTGKTPSATLSSILHKSVKEDKSSIFNTTGKRPKYFYLKEKEGLLNINFEKNITDKDQATSLLTGNYTEADLHPLLVYFAYHAFCCYSQTIDHKKSSYYKKFREMAHPDIVGCVFPELILENEVQHLSYVLGNSTVKLMSFELKKALNSKNLTTNFFQAVSNSSWANESYLVAAEISNKEDFISELSRLSSSFGIGVIELNINNPNASKILYPAKIKENIDWKTLNKLTSMNSDFEKFIKRVRIDFKSREIRKEAYDKILDIKELTENF